MENSKKVTKEFIGRKEELETLQKINQKREAAILIVQGRRRVGKTSLIEYAFKKEKILKIEGIEGLSEKMQILHVQKSLMIFLKDPLINKINCKNWGDIFEILTEKTKKLRLILYFEEVQWLADYKDHFAAYLKKSWDNGFQYNPDLLIVLCGSSPSFMLNKIIQSKALYNRSQHILTVNPFTIEETQMFLGGSYSKISIMDAYLTLGGIPEYLKYLQNTKSLYLKICENSFKKDAPFYNEYGKIYVSALAKNSNYKKIVEYLGRHRFATREQISSHVKQGSGGGLSELLLDLEVCGFIEKIHPFSLGPKSKLIRYAISDSYIQFYTKFIQPLSSKIQNSQFQKSASSALKINTYRQWLGYGFERWCRKEAHRIAHLLGFSAISYNSGAYFSRETKDSSFQIDLVFDRADRVITVCEIKYKDAPVGIEIIVEFEEKLKKLKSKKTVEKILISATGADEKLQNRSYFDRILTLDDLLI